MNLLIKQSLDFELVVKLLQLHQEPEQQQQKQEVDSDLSAGWYTSSY